MNGEREDDRRERQMEFIVSTLARVAIQQEQTAAALAAEAEERRAGEAEREARDVLRDRRLDRIENIARSFVTIGRRTRREFRDALSALTSSHIRAEDERFADRERLDALLAALTSSHIRAEDERLADRERLVALLAATERNTGAVADLTAAQGRDRENINALADAVRQLVTRGNGNGTRGGKE